MQRKGLDASAYQQLAAERERRLDMPSLITNAYVRRALDLIEERMVLAE